MAVNPKIPDLALRGAANADELRQANDLMAKIHYQDYFEAMRWIETRGLAYPGFEREHTRIAFWRGELASALRITTDTIRIGEARLKMGGIGWVSTAPRHRKKGIAHQLMLDALRYMRKHNYHVAMLFGIPNFYHRFGFATCLNEYTTTIDVEEALVAPCASWRARVGKPGDIGAIQRLHEVGDAESSCSILRQRGHIAGNWDRWKAVRVLTDDQGKVMAYFLPRRAEGLLCVEEIGAADAETWRSALLEACARHAAKEYVGAIRFAAPPAHPFIRHVARYRAAHTAHGARDGGGMLAAVNLGELLESMIPEWEHRVTSSALAREHVELTLLAEGAAYRVRSHRGAIDVAPASGPNKLSLRGEQFMHLLSGQRGAAEVLDDERRVLTRAARAFAATLFPRRTPYVWTMDRF